MEYVTDPEVFFGSDSSYMLQVLLQDDDETTPRVVVEPGPDGPPRLRRGNRKAAARWRLLILEDCGELLGQTAKQETGQGLARLLNTVDGLIGQGLPLMVLITTNEAPGRLHPAVTRPGRAVANIEFTRFEPAEALTWLREHGVDIPVTQPMTLAEMYAAVAGEHTPEALVTTGQYL